MITATHPHPGVLLLSSTPTPEPAAAAAPAAQAREVRLEVPADADTCTPCGREALRMAHAEQGRDQAALEADVAREVASRYAAFRPA